MLTLSTTVAHGMGQGSPKILKTCSLSSSRTGNVEEPSFPRTKDEQMIYMRRLPRWTPMVDTPNKNLTPGAIEGSLAGMVDEQQGTELAIQREQVFRNAR